MQELYRIPLNRLLDSVLMFKLSSATKHLIHCNSARILRLSIANTRAKNTLSMKSQIFLIIPITQIFGGGWGGGEEQCHNNKLQN